jgi:hypothetical protein
MQVTDHRFGTVCSFPTANFDDGQVGRSAFAGAQLSAFLTCLDHKSGAPAQSTHIDAFEQSLP